MLISFKYNFVFFCATKTASSAVETMLKPYSDISLVGLPAFRHTNYKEYETYIQPYLKEKTGNGHFETLCIIREPLSWLNSWYRFRLRSEIQNSNHPNHKYSTSHLEFEKFIQAYISPNPPEFAQVGTISGFVENRKNEVGIQKLFCYENLTDFMEYMSSKVGKRLKIKYQNVSPKSNFSSGAVSHSFRKIACRLNLIQPDKEEMLDKYYLPEKIMNELKIYMHKDFNLYKKVKLLSR